MSISVNSMREMLDGSCEAIYVTDPAYRILYTNRAARLMAEQILHTKTEGEKCFQCLTGRDVPCPFCRMEEMSEEQFLVRKYSSPSGRIFELRGKLIDWDGETAHIEYIRDITEQTESENRLNNILDNISGGIAVYQLCRDGRVKRLMFTDGLSAMQGYSRQEYEELGGENALNLVYPEDRERLTEELWKHCQMQADFSMIYRVRHKERGYIWVSLTATPAGVDADGCVRYNAAFTNVSQPFDLYGKLLDNSENGLLVTDRRTREIYFTNQAAGNILKNAWEKCENEHGCSAPASENGVLCEGCSLSPRDGLPRKVQSGGKIYQVHTHFMEWMDRPVAAQYFSDISEEMELQEKLVSDEERYRLVVEKSGIALVDYDLKTDTVYMNDRFKKYEASTVPNIRDFFAHEDGLGTVHPEDASALAQFYRELESRHATSARIRLKTQDGQYRWTELNALELCDEKGQLLRKIGFFRDVDAAVRQYNDLKIRYDYEMARQNSFEDDVVERMLLDLTDDRIIRAANPHTASLTRLIGMSMEDLLRARLSHTEGKKEQEELSGFMNREALIHAYYTGETPVLEMLAPVPGAGDKRYFMSIAQLAKNPGNGHIIAFIETRDIDRTKMETTLMRRLLETSYESAVVFDAVTGRIKIGVRAGENDFRTDIGENYEVLAREEIIRKVPAAEQENVMKQMSLASIRENLKEKRLCSGRVALEVDGKRYYKMWTAVYFDDSGQYILLTIAEVTDVYKKDLQAAQELKQALKNAEVASQAKNTFLARMSHEIRTPITTVAGIMDLMRMACQKNDIQPETLLEQIETADAANQYLLTLINDILDISKIESNELRLEPAAADIREVIVPLCAMIEPLAAKKKIHFTMERKTRSGNWYKTDVVRLQQILMNLLNNAVKFTPEGGRVHFTGELLRLEGRNATIRFVVSDTGVGISEDFRDKVFEPFRQEYTDSRSGYGGTGIGLSISRQLARLMGGDITFESRKGQGSTFTVTVQMELVQDRDEEKEASPEPECLRLDGIRVLLCEDNEINQMIIRQLLEAGGCSVTTADDGLQAVEMFASGKTGETDIILMDIQMPKLDGLEAAQQIRKLSRPDAQTVPILAMSANAYEEDRQRSVAAGMNAHLSKPVDTQELYRAIYRYCRDKKPQKEETKTE